jgi:hypothetical protein
MSDNAINPDILWHPAVLVPASQLLGNTAIRFWHDQLFVKPPKCGSVVAWHQGQRLLSTSKFVTVSEEHFKNIFFCLNQTIAIGQEQSQWLT